MATTALLFLSVLSVLTQAKAPPGDEPRARSVDPHALEEWVAMEQSFDDARRAEARAAIAAHLEHETAFSDAEFYMEVRRIVGLAENGHTNAWDEPIRERFGLVPLRTYWFSDGMRIVRARAPHEALLACGSRPSRGGRSPRSRPA